MAVIPTAPPRVLTLAEYERDWKPRGWELLPIGPTATYRQEEWGEWEAIRDLVQNALDETEHYTWGYDARGLWIADRGAGVSVRSFLLGPAKLKPEWARGRFGEGMKLALLTFLRLGYSVQVLTAHRELWAVFVRVKTGPDEYDEQLQALWRVNGSRVGTAFHIIGYTGSVYENRFAVNLPRSLILAETPSPITEPKIRYNQLIEAARQAASDIGGVIYARDIYMRDIDSKFSYNLWGFSMAPDRHGPNNEPDLWVDMGRLWCGIDNVLLLEKFLWMVTDPPRENASETRNISMDSYSMGSEPVTNKRYIDLVTDHGGAWRTAWGRVAGPGAVIRTESRWDGMVKHLGYTSVSLQWGVRDALSGAIMTDSILIQESQDRLRETKVLPDPQLTANARAHLKLARAIADPFSVKSVQGAVIPPASDRARTAGYYDHIMEEIVLHLETLENARRTIDAMIHELGHHRAYKTTGDIKLAEDLQPAHSEAMTYVAARVVEYAAAGHFDDELKEAVW